MRDIAKSVAVIIVLIVTLILSDVVLGPLATAVIFIVLFFFRALWSTRHGLLRHVVPGISAIDYALFIAGASATLFVLSSDTSGGYRIVSFFLIAFIWAFAHILRLPSITQGAAISFPDAMFGQWKRTGAPSVEMEQLRDKSE